MEERRWLLPFTHGVDIHALLVVLNMARTHNVTLVPVSFIPQQRVADALQIRPERIQQSKDFLEAIRWRAEQRHVTIECHEVTTTDVLQSIRWLAQEWCCTDIVIVMRDHTTIFLKPHEAQVLCTEPPRALVLLRLPKSRNRTGFSFPKWLPLKSGRRQDDEQEEGVASEENLLKPHHRAPHLSKP